MNKLFTICFLVCSSVWATTGVRGFIYNSDSRPVSGAKVLVFNGLNSFLLQRVDSDRNGTYFVNLSPGPYRVLILKKGYVPMFATFTIRGDKTFEVLTHQLQEEVNLSDNRNIKTLKHILRSSNREPHRSLAPSYAQTEPDLEVGTWRGEMSTGSVNDAAGQMTEVSLVSIDSYVHDQLEVIADVARSEWDNERDVEAVTRLVAGMNAFFGQWQLGINGMQASVEKAGDRFNQAQDFQTFAQYQGRLQSETLLILKERKLPIAEQHSIQLEQTLSHSLEDQNISYYVRAERHDLFDKQAEAAELSTFIQSGKGAWEARYIQKTGYGAAFDQQAIMRHFQVEPEFAPLQIAGKLGLSHQSDRLDWVQDTKISYDLNQIRLEAHTTRKYDLNWIYQSDLVAETRMVESSDYLVGNQRVQSDAFSLQIMWEPGPWNLGIEAGKSERETEFNADLWSSHIKSTGITSRETRLTGQHRRWGTKIQITSNHSKARTHQLDRVEMAFAQDISPFSQTDLSFKIILKAANQPDVPGWWLLDELPWNLQDGKNFSGHLSMSF